MDSIVRRHIDVVSVVVTSDRKFLLDAVVSGNDLVESLQLLMAYCHQSSKIYSHVLVIGEVQTQLQWAVRCIFDSPCSQKTCWAWNGCSMSLPFANICMHQFTFATTSLRSSLFPPKVLFAR